MLFFTTGWCSGFCCLSRDENDFWDIFWRRQKRKMFIQCAFHCLGTLNHDPNINLHQNSRRREVVTCCCYRTWVEFALWNNYHYCLLLRYCHKGQIARARNKYLYLFMIGVLSYVSHFEIIKVILIWLNILRFDFRQFYGIMLSYHSVSPSSILFWISSLDPDKTKWT